MSENLIAVITGASQGIGKTIFELFQERNITSIGVSRYIQEGEHTRRCDIRDGLAVHNLFFEIIDTYGKIDILVNNAGIVSNNDILDLPLYEWENIIETNLTGAFLCCKYSINHMKIRRFGKIVNISSIAGGFRSSTASVAYTCSKYGLIGLTRQLALHYAKDNININCVCPSQTLTPMLNNINKEQIDKIPAGRLATTYDIAKAVYFLCSDDASYLHGAIIDVNGGQF